MMFRTKALAGACALILVPLVASQVMAADPPAHLGQGTALGTAWSPTPRYRSGRRRARTT